jgi:hypothetical protein
MKTALQVAMLAIGAVVFSGSYARSAQSDSFLVDFLRTGTVSCREYTTANGMRFVTYQWWLLGFVSGAGHASKNPNLRMANIDASAATEWVGKYCIENPGVSLASAATTLVAALESGRAAP